jgi:hypothetical protein
MHSIATVALVLLQCFGVLFVAFHNWIPPDVDRGPRLHTEGCLPGIVWVHGAYWQDSR